MTRFQIVVLSVVCCVFGGLALRGPAEYRDVAYALNAGLAVVLFFVAGDDLRRRGYRLGYLLAASYVLPLVGLVVYGAASNRPRRVGDDASVLSRPGRPDSPAPPAHG